MTAIDTRHLKRDSLFLMADVRTDGSAASERMRVRNLSDGGMMVEGELIATSGTRVIVRLRNIGEVGGVVAWNQSARVGIAFDEPIDASRARTNLASGQSEAPRYARPNVPPPPEQAYRVRKV